MSLIDLFQRKNKKLSQGTCNKDQLFQTAQSLPDLIYGHKIEDLNGIPLIITEEHNHVFPFWQASDIRGATLIHIDSHSDLGDNVSIDNPFKMNQQLSLDYYKKMHIGQFILPAVYYGMIKDMVWISPFQKENDLYLQYIDQDRIKTKFNFLGKICWNKEFEREELGGATILGDSDKMKYGLFLKPKDLKKLPQADYILDIDLDAFAKKFYGQSTMIEILYALQPLIGVEGWEQRIKETFCLLESLPRPNLITVTRSQGETPYVPKDILEKVQAETLMALRKAYS